jgi:apolipoprotein N-acyltransferase
MVELARRQTGFGLKLVLAAVFGAVLMLSFAPSYAWWLAPYCLAGLWLLLPGQPALRAGLLGLAFGLAWFGSGVWWLFDGLAQHSDAGTPLALLLTLLLGTYLALYPALALAAFAALTARAPARLGQGPWPVLAGASLWTLAEWLRANLFGGFPWLLSGTAHASGPLGAFAPLVGVFGVGWLNAALALLLADSLTRWRSGWRRPLAELGAATAVLGLACLLLMRVDWTDPAGTLSVRLMQANIAQHDKTTPQGLAEAAERYSLLADGGAAELTLFPETAFPVAWDAMPASVRERWRRIATERNSTLVVGTFGAAGARQLATNSAVALLPGSAAASYDYRYDKVHLVPFGEQTWSWSTWLTDRVYAHFGALLPGAPGQAPLVLPQGRVALGICFESLFDSATAAKARDAELLVNLTNFAWFDGSYAAAQHLQAGQMRARETGRWLVQASNSGLSALVGPDGAVREVLPAETVAVLDGEVGLRRGDTPFMKFGNTPLLALCLLALAAAWRRRGQPFLSTRLKGQA